MASAPQPDRIVPIFADIAEAQANLVSAFSRIAASWSKPVRAMVSAMNALATVPGLRDLIDAAADREREEIQARMIRETPPPLPLSEWPIIPATGRPVRLGLQGVVRSAYVRKMEMMPLPPVDPDHYRLPPLDIREGGLTATPVAPRLRDMTMTDTLIQEHTCRFCGEEFPTVAEVVTHDCPDSPAPRPIHEAPTPAVLVRERTANERANRFAGRCDRCRGTVEAEAGLLIGSRQAGWSTRHLVCPVAPVLVRDCADGEFHMVGETIYRTKRSRSTGSVYALRGELHSGTIEWVYEGRSSLALLSDATLMTWQQARDFGARYNFCIRCSLTLDGTDGRSIAAGYGETCARRMGWPYPSAAEAREILAERTDREGGTVR